MARQISTTTVGFRFVIRGSYYGCGFQLLLAEMVVIVVGVLCFISSNDGTSGCRFRFYCRRRELHQFHISGFTMHKDFCSSCGSFFINVIDYHDNSIFELIKWTKWQKKRSCLVLCTYVQSCVLRGGVTSLPTYMISCAAYGYTHTRRPLITMFNVHGYGGVIMSKTC